MAQKLTKIHILPTQNKGLLKFAKTKIEQEIKSVRGQ